MEHDKENREIGNDEVWNAEAQEADLAADSPPVSAEEALKESEEKASQYLARLQRAQADYINYKRRVEQERSEFVRQAGADVILGILPALDDLDRALESVPADIKEHSWVDGIRHISRKLHSELEARGLQKIESNGQTFDPNIHESVALSKGKEGVVVEEVKPGYRLYDRVLRPCSVVVGNGEE